MKQMSMNETVGNATPMLFSYDPEQFWTKLRILIREEVSQLKTAAPIVSLYETPGLAYKPLYKMAEVCQMFSVTKPTLYDWIKHGKLTPLKIRSRVFFLWQDIQKLMKNDAALAFTPLMPASHQSGTRA